MASDTGSNGCAIEQAKSLNVWDVTGKATSFQDILSRQRPGVKRILLVFIRHFFCGIKNCQEYVRRLATDLAPAALPEDLSILIMGCGAPSLISSYIEVTSCPFPIYADPSTQLYKLLGMQRSLSLGFKGPAYIQHSLASGVVKSIVQGVKRIPSGDVGKAGDLSTNGGEFLLALDELSNWTISWSHYMVNTRDHTEIDVLKAKLRISDEYEQTQTSNLKHAADIANIPQELIMRRSLSLRRHAWMRRFSEIARSSTSRNSMIRVS